MRLALVSRELSPLRGGGIGQFVANAARILSQVAEVTVITAAGLGGVYEREFQRLRAAGDQRLPPAGVRVVFVPEPSVEEAEGFYHLMHCYSARVWEVLQEVYADAPPDLIEFADYLGEGFVTVQAAQALERFLAATRICVRLHTSTELVELLNGFCKPDLPSRAVHELERGVLRGADRVIWQGGDILGTYRRYYGADALAPAVRIRYPFQAAAPEAPGPEAPAGALAGVEPGQLEPHGGEGLRLLYMGRFERRKGVVDLVDALRGLGREDVSLTLVGGDTLTGPLGCSVRAQVQQAVAGDGRFELLDGAGPERLASLVRGCDVVVVPSLWECWPFVALEALHLNRPVLGTPVGGLVELACGGGGWLASGTGSVALAEALLGLLDDREGVGALVRSGAPLARARALCDEREILDGYEGLARAVLTRPVAGGVRRRLVGGEEPLVSVVVPYFRAWRWVGEAVRSLLSQSYRRLEVVLVVDGSFGVEDWVVGELSARFGVLVVCQENRGLGAARNFGISQCRGRYVFPLDADNLAEPSFVQRCVEVLEACPQVAYVTAWSRYVDERGVAREGGDVGYEPLGNRSGLLAEENVAGDAAAVIRRWLFDAGFCYSEELTSYEDWAFYRRLAAAGHYGVVIPRRLLGYRVREDSMQRLVAVPNRQRLLGEIEAHIKHNQTRWTSSSD